MEDKNRLKGGPVKAGTCGGKEGKELFIPSATGKVILTKLTKLTWSTDKPIVPGWYWHRDKADNGLWYQEEVLFFYDDMTTIYERDGFCEHVSDINGEWSGPLETPE